MLLIINIIIVAIKSVPLLFLLVGVQLLLSSGVMVDTKTRNARRAALLI